MLPAPSRAAPVGGAEAREQAKMIIDAAYVEQSRLVSQDEVSRQAAIEGERIVRIDEKRFGACIVCGDDVERKRLEAVPWAKHCLSCQEKIEAGIL